MIVTDEVELPDGRKVQATLKGCNERDVNAFVETDLNIEWLDGRPLTADEYNIDFGRYYLHEWVAEQLHKSTKWSYSDIYEE
jgi:hypothetical protein